MFEITRGRAAITGALVFGVAVLTFTMYYDAGPTHTHDQKWPLQEEGALDATDGMVHRLRREVQDDATSATITTTSTTTPTTITTTSTTTSTTITTTSTTTPTTTTVCSTDPEVMNVSLTPGQYNMTVNWEANDSCTLLSGFEVRWTWNGSEKGSYNVSRDERGYTITDLPPCTTISVTVKPKVDDDIVPGVTDSDDTLDENPSVTINTINPDFTAMKISWNSTDRCLLHDGFLVNWVSNDSSINGSADKGHNNYSHTVTDLPCGTSFTVTVTPTTHTSSVYGTSDEKLSTTLKRDPSVDSLILVAEMNSMNVAWKYNDTCEFRDGFKLEYKEDGSSSTSKYFPRNTTNYIIEPLNACSDIYVTVSPFSGDNGTFGSSSSNNETTLPEVPPKVAAVNIMNETSTSLSVSWAPSDTKCSVIYNVCYDGSPIVEQPACSGGDKDGLNTTDTQLPLLGLKPYYSYEVSVYAVVEGMGSDGATVNSSQTLQTAPVAPSSVQANSVSNYSLTLNWTKPCPVNGKMESYIVKWTDNVTGEIFNDTTNGKTQSLDLGGLTACTAYEFEVKGKTEGGGEGEAVRTMEETTAEVSDKVNVSVTNATSTSLNVHWTEAYTRCQVTYELLYECQKLWGDMESYGRVDVSVNDTSYVLDELKPYSNCSTCVKVLTIQGTSEESCQVEETQEDVPTSVRDVDVYEVKYYRASVRWNVPDEENGVLWYEVSVVDNTGNDIYTVNTTSNSTTITGLKDNKQYNLTIKACTRVGCKSSGSYNYMTLKDPTVVIVCSIIAALLLILLLALLILKRKEIAQQFNGSSQKESPVSVETPSEEVAVIEPLKDNINEYIQMLMKDDGMLLEREYNSIPVVWPGETYNIAKMNYNKNRYANILPYDSTIVSLQPPGDIYINASYIKDCETNECIIAAQGPIPSGVKQFWQLIAEQTVSVVVMLTRCMESGKDKCAQYWPVPGAQCKFPDNITVRNCHEQNYGFYTKRTIQLRAAHLSVLVTQFQYTSWPDFGVPSNHTELLDLMVEVKKATLGTMGKMLVHCSAGVGRSGTFIGLWALWHKEGLVHGNEIRVKHEVENMRRQRCSMVQTKEQYLLLYKCYADYLRDPGRWPLSSHDENNTTSNGTPENRCENPTKPEPIYVNVGFGVNQLGQTRETPSKQQSKGLAPSGTSNEPTYSNTQHNDEMRRTLAPMVQMNRQHKPIDGDNLEGTQDRPKHVYNNQRKNVPLNSRNESNSSRVHTSEPIYENLPNRNRNKDLHKTGNQDEPFYENVNRVRNIYNNRSDGIATNNKNISDPIYENVNYK